MFQSWGRSDLFILILNLFPLIINKITDGKFIRTTLFLYITAKDKELIVIIFHLTALYMLREFSLDIELLPLHATSIQHPHIIAILDTLTSIYNDIIIDNQSGG